MAMLIGCFESMQIFTITSSRYGIDTYEHTDLTGFGSSLSIAVFLKVTLTIPTISSEIRDPISPTRLATVLWFTILTSLNRLPYNNMMLSLYSYMHV